MSSQRPKWLILSDDLLGPLMQLAFATLDARISENPDLAMIPHCALLHLADCLATSMEANEQGRHSAAICLVRQCVETMTIVDLGLRGRDETDEMMAGWNSGKKSHGELRAWLEREMWPRYGKGLWDEPWADFFRNLSRAVQPYAHYTHELMGWQFRLVHYAGGNRYLAEVGRGSYDPLKASRITLFHALLCWTIGRLLQESGNAKSIRGFSLQIRELGVALGSSKLLFDRGDWGLQLLPDMPFRPGSDWHDE